jgi:hypothetical protein
MNAKRKRPAPVKHSLRAIPQLIGLVTIFLPAVLSASAAERPRLAVLTDIGGDPDDQQSLVRLMVYANESQISDRR